MSEDLIKRSDAIKAILQKPAIHGSEGSWYHADDIRDALNAIPSADRPQGEWHNGFYDFLWNVINPNEMQKYIEMYEAQPIAVDGAQMKGADDEDNH